MRQRISSTFFFFSHFVEAKKAYPSLARQNASIKYHLHHEACPWNDSGRHGFYGDSTPQILTFLACPTFVLWWSTYLYMLPDISWQLPCPISVAGVDTRPRSFGGRWKRNMWVVFGFPF